MTVKLNYKHNLEPFNCMHCPIDWGCRIQRLLLCRGVRPLPNECPV